MTIKLFIYYYIITVHIIYYLHTIVNTLSQSLKHSSILKISYNFVIHLVLKRFLNTYHVILVFKINIKLNT